MKVIDIDKSWLAAYSTDCIESQGRRDQPFSWHASSAYLFIATIDNNMQACFTASYYFTINVQLF